MINDPGPQVGERIVLQFDSHAEAIWNEDSKFHSISASSLAHVLEFEKALRSQRERIVSRIDSVQKVSFTPSDARDGRTEGGVAYSEKQFRSSDCETITTRTEYYSTSASAHEEMQKRLKESTNIVERGSKLNAAGQSTGERAVAMFTAARPSDYLEDTVVIWTVNTELHTIKGPFTYVLELERRNYPNN